MVGLFLWRIFLNFPLKSLGGNGSRGKLAMRPKTTSSSPWEQSVSLSAMSLTAFSSKDMLDGRKSSDTSIIIPKKSFRVVPGFPSFLLEYNWSLPFPSLQTSFLVRQQICCAEMQPELWSVCFNLCTCQGSSASYSSIHELGRCWIT